MIKLKTKVTKSADMNMAVSLNVAGAASGSPCSRRNLTSGNGFFSLNFFSRVEFAASSISSSSSSSTTTTFSSVVVGGVLSADMGVFLELDRVVTMFFSVGCDTMRCDAMRWEDWVVRA